MIFPFFGVTFAEREGFLDAQECASEDQGFEKTMATYREEGSISR